ncbi:MAG: hypothetical protein OEV76_01055 [Anaerolineae bacterium]|nr:hypothetical protein [Anaerolineae bacterium]
MELTLRRFGITEKVLRERAEESTPDIIRRLQWRRKSGQHHEHLTEYLQASGSRFVSPIR